MKNGTFIGGILMIIGTSIGGGMLALPVVTAHGGFLYSSLFLFVCWLFMTAGALLVLEVNLYLPEGTNLISMVENTLGMKGKIIAWVSYLILLYSLLSAYVAGGGEVIDHFFSLFHLKLPFILCVCLFVLVFGSVLLRGMGTVDIVNRFIMILKMSAYLCIIFFTLTNIQFDYYTRGQPETLIFTATTIVTSFGFAIIVPSLRTYFKSDVIKLRRAIIIGSFVPLICYILWECAIFGVVPLVGKHGLYELAASSTPVKQLLDSLTFGADQNAVLVAVNIFTTVCIFTSFLGVSLCLIDFLIDGLKLHKKKSSLIFVYAITFLPPICFVLFIPSLFTWALSFAGIFCMILLTILPVFMAWSGRYVKKYNSEYRLFGGKPLLLSILVFSFIVFSIGVIQSFKLFLF